MKKKRLFLIPLCLLLLAAAWFLLRSRIPQRWYTADELGIPQLQSPLGRRRRRRGRLDGHGPGRPGLYRHPPPL